MKCSPPGPSWIFFPLPLDLKTWAIPAFCMALLVRSPCCSFWALRRTPGVLAPTPNPPPRPPLPPHEHKTDSISSDKTARLLSAAPPSPFPPWPVLALALRCRVTPWGFVGTQVVQHHRGARAPPGLAPPPSVPRAARALRPTLFCCLLSNQSSQAFCLWDNSMLTALFPPLNSQ